MNADGTNQVKLTNNSHYDRFPSWSPDGTKIAFSSLKDTNMGICVMNSDGTNKIRLADGHLPSWSPDGTKIAFSSSTGISVMNADGTNQIPLLNAYSLFSSASWSK